ncbi:type VII secretion target [Hoyosella altamirensis]|uniref:type VII secretion target n=1 Tax=Hoyosella altamirensis TaxID=616997 RepID=UPI0018DE0500|nr:type VII secretion target [Hoyosella altamirensis]
MAELAVDSAEIEKFAHGVADLAAEADGAVDYVHAWVQISSGQAGYIFRHILGTVSNTRNVLTSNHEKIARLSRESASGLECTAQHYAAAESESRAGIIHAGAPLSQPTGAVR